MAAYDLPVARPTILGYTNAGADARGGFANIESARSNREKELQAREALDWTLGAEDRRRALNAERAMEAKRLFDENLLQQRRNFDTESPFAKSLDSQGILTTDGRGRILEDIEARKTRENEIFSTPGNWADPAQLEASMRAGLKQKGFSDEAINTEINGLLSQHYSTLDPAVAAQRIKDLGSKKTTVETFADQLFPKQFAPSGTNASGQPVNAQGMTAAQHQDYLIKGGDYVDDWIKDQKLKKGTRRWWVNGVNVGATDVFTDDVPKFVETLGHAGIPPAEAIRMLDADMRNNTIGCRL